MKIKLPLLYFIMFFCSKSVYPKIRIFTSAYNRPDFIEIQEKTFKKFLKDDYELIVFNDASNNAMSEEIRNKCIDLNLKHIRVPQEIHDLPYLERVEGERFNNHSPAVCNANVVQYALNTMGFSHNDIVAIFDSDLFLVRDFSIREYLRNKDLSAWMRSCCVNKKKCIKNHPGIPGVKFMWIGLVFLDMRTLPKKETINFNCGLINNKIHIDAGGYTYYYLKNNPNARGIFFNKLSLSQVICQNCRLATKPAPACVHNTKMLLEKNFDVQQIKLAQSISLTTRDRPLEFFLNATFLHYQAGSNYTGYSTAYHISKTNVLNKYLELILDN